MLNIYKTTRIILRFFTWKITGQNGGILLYIYVRWHIISCSPVNKAVVAIYAYELNSGQSREMLSKEIKMQIYCFYTPSKACI